MERNISFEVEIGDELDMSIRHVLGRYWAFNGKKFEERPGKIAKCYDMEVIQVLHLVQESSKAIIQDNCAGCQRLLNKMQVSSQTKFISYWNTKNFCPSCQVAEDERLVQESREEERNYYENRDRSLENAVLGRAWLKLTFEEALFLLRLIKSPYQNIRHSEYAHLYPHENSEFIDKIMYYGLIHEDSPYDMDDIGYHFSPRLPEQLKNYLKEFEKVAEHDLKEFKDVKNENISPSSSVISFELKEYNPYQNTKAHINTGTFIIQQDTVIKAGTTCIYAIQPLENENMLLSIIPLPDNIDSRNKLIL